ncbi:MAG: GIY-YIG nuclease family protein [Pseudomonadales bacterium]|nr:GIY-YIG nuclease family protein [Pseudomonadales bacterium]MCP5184470.1 GIY-YIG nuclease family protein [Pseudomonadales bacterium]
MTELTPQQKKALIAEYRKTPRPMGLYRVLNEQSGRFVVGTHRDVQARLNRFLANLRTGTEMNKALLADWQAAAGEGFRFEVLDTLEPADEPGYDPTDDLRTLEALWWETSGADRAMHY